MPLLLAVLAKLGVFLGWTLMLYWVHRLAHQIPFIGRIHATHHRFIKLNPAPRWHWSNLFLFNDDWNSTLDLWVSEVVPTLLFCSVTGQWWLAVFYYGWAAVIQESIEHNPSFCGYPFLTSGRWHLIHHSKARYNFGVFTPLWDTLFGTNQRDSQ